MSLGRSAPAKGRGGGGAGLQRAGARSSASLADATMEDELLRTMEREIQENTRGRVPPFSSAPSSPSRLARGAPRRVLGIAMTSSAASLPTRRSPARSSRAEQVSSDVTGTSGSAPEVLARTGREEGARPEQHQAAHTRSGYRAMMRSALAKIQEGADGSEEDAMTSLMELTYGKPELPNMPELPHEFATKWLRDDSVDQLYHQCFCTTEEHLPVANETLPHSFTARNHLHDTISARRLDQEQALHEIQRLSKITKGEQPCLHKWSGLLPELIDLQRKWKSTWTQNLEEQRLTIILNLSVHRPNREILAGSKQLPEALKKIVDKLHKLGSPASPLAKVASLISILSEFDMFRKRLLDNGGMEMLRDLFKIEDPAVRKEVVTAIRGLCTDHEGMTHARLYNVADSLLECLMVSNEVLLLLDCLPKDPCVVDKICDKAVELVNIIMDEQEFGPVTPEATYSAISLVYTIVRRNARKLEKVKNLEDLKERLSALLSNGIPTRTMFHLKEIIKALSVCFQSPTELRRLPVEERQMLGPSHVSPNEFVFWWSLKNDEISYPLYAEILGEADLSIKSRKEWDDIRVIRKLRPLRDSEKSSSRTHFKMIHNSYRKGSPMPNPIYTMFVEDPKNGDRLKGFKILEMLVCPLCGKVMVDPVTIATGKTFDRQCLRDWFHKHGHICPITCEAVSSTVLRNERARGYLVEWRAAGIN